MFKNNYRLGILVYLSEYNSSKSYFLLTDNRLFFVSKYNSSKSDCSCKLADDNSSKMIKD